MSTTEYKVGVTLQANTAQYTAEYVRAGQTHATFVSQVRTGSATASSALQSTTTVAQALGTGLHAAGLQGAQGLAATASAAQAAQSAGSALLAGLREQIAVSGKSTEELLRYRAAQAGVAADAAPLILQLQNQRAAQQHAAEAARAEEAAQRANAAAKQQSVAAQESYLAGLRDQAALQGKSQIEVMRYRAAQLGVAEGAEPYIRALEQGNSLHRVGTLSAKEHAMAMRMLPMQMTDVVTSVASGMPIWMVAIQQGGQIKDSFHGVGNALRAILSAISPTVAGVAVLTGVVGLGVTAYAQGSREADGYRHAIVMTGNAAGVTVDRMSDMARAIGQATGSQSVAADALTQMAGSGKIAGDNLQYFTEVAVGLEKYAATPVKNTVQELAELSKAPLQASIKLNEQYHYLTVSVYEQIKALEEQGRKEEAVALAQRSYISAFEARKNELVANLGSMERAWNSITGAAKRGWDAILNIGREDTAQQKLDTIGSRIATLRKELDKAGIRPGTTGGNASVMVGAQLTQARREKELETLLAQQAALQESVRLEKRGAEAAAEGARQAEAKAAWDKEGDQFKARAAKRDEEIRKAEIEGRELVNKKLITEQDLAERIADIRQKYKDPKGATAGIKVSDGELAALQGQLDAAKRYGEQLAALGIGASELNAGERESLKIGQQLERVTDAKTAARLREKQAIADSLGVQLRSNDGLEQSLKAAQAVVDANYKDAQSIALRAREQDAANAVLGKSRTAIEQMTLATLEHQLAEAEGSDRFDPAYVASLRAKIAAQKDWVAALGQADYNAAKQHVDELVRGAQELSKAYADEQALSGLTALEREKIVAQRQVELKYAKELAAIDKSAYSDTQKQALREEALKARRIESAAAVAKAQEQYMARASDEINRTLTDALMRGFEAGKGAAENLAETTVNLFKSMVLRPTISAVMTPVSLVINGIVQQGLNAVGLGSGGGLLNMASNASSLYSLATGNSVLGNVAGTVGGWLGLSGAATGLGLSAASAGAGAIGAGIGAGLGLGSSAAAGTGLGLSLGGSGLGITAGSAGAGAIGAGLGSSAAAGGAAASSGLMGALGAIPGWGWALAGIALLGGLGGVFKGSTPHIGGAASYSAAGGTTTGLGVLDQGLTFGVSSRHYDKGVEEQSANIAKTLVGLLDATAKSFGTQAGYFAATAFADDSSKDGAWGSLMIRLGDKSVLDWADTQTSRWAPREFADGEEGQRQYFAAIAASARDALKTAVGDAEWAREMLDALGESPTLEALGPVVQQIGQVQALFGGLGNSIQGFAGYANDAITALLRATGGAENLAALTSSYYQNYYTEGERSAALTRDLTTQFAALGYELPQSRDELRALMDANIALGAAGAPTVAALLNLQGSLAQITRSAEDAAKAQQEAAERQAKAEADARKAATDAAWSALQKSIQAARDAAQAEVALREERLATARAVVDVARDQARELRGLVDSTVAMTAAQANAWIDSALVAARSGTLPDAEELRQAIAGARSGMGTSAYSSRLDYEAAQLILANKLDAIGDNGTAQVDLNELLLEQSQSALDKFDQMLKQGREALDEARGNTVAVLSVDDAVRQFYARFVEEQNGGSATAAGAGAGTGSSAGGVFVSGPGSSGGVGGGGIDQTGLKAQNIRDYVGLVYKDSDNYADPHSLAQINASAYLSHWSLKDMSDALQIPPEDIVNLMEGAGFTHWRSQLPAFAGGGAHLGGLRLVGEDGPELEVTGPSRIYNASQTQQLLAGLQGGGSAEVVAAIKELQRQGYEIGRAILVLLQSVEGLARKSDAIGVKQREEQAA